MKQIFLEAEGFRTLGGWLIDQQSVAEMGSPYIMAHGLGIPTADAVTSFAVTEAGEYTVWARTRDWTAPWGNLRAGKFCLAVDGETLPEVLGTNGREWGWQKAGVLSLSEGEHTVALHDLTGFDGRCDAVYLTAEGDVPPEGEALAAFRTAHICPEPEICETEYDLVVVGGGIAGICTALAASRCGLSSLLIHDREVLGGCNSSEVRVCLGGHIHIPPYDKLGNIVKEIQPILGSPSLFEARFYEDERKRLVFSLRESKGKCTLALGEHMTAITMENGAITSVETLHVRSGKRKIYRGKLFADCTGDATVARMAGAEVMYGREAKDTFGESLGAESYEKLVMGQSIRWYSTKKAEPSPFPLFDTGMFQSDADCLHVKNGDWEQESGFRRDMATETEYIRDYGLYAIFGNWSFQKNRSERKDEYANLALAWVSHLGGKRESYRVVGDHIMTQNDIENHVPYEDGTACLSWTIDIHFPEAENEERFGEAFRSFAYHRGIGEPYPVPYRCLYARDVENLFLGGRTVSTSHVAFASVRVMRTLGMLGEVAGLASVICRRHDCTPRQVYTDHLEELRELLRAGVPSPDSFQCGLGGVGESYHFKDAGRIRKGQPETITENPYREKVEKNIKKLNLDHLFKDEWFL